MPVSRRSLRLGSSRVRSIRLTAVVLLAIAAVALACGTLLALLARGDASYIVPVGIAYFGTAILIGVALADIRYAARLERRLREQEAAR